MTTIVDINKIIRTQTEVIDFDLNRLFKYAKLLKDVGLDKIATDILDVVSSVDKANTKISDILRSYIIDSYKAQNEASDEMMRGIINIVKGMSK